MQRRILQLKRFITLCPRGRGGGGGRERVNVVMQIAVVDENQNMTDFL